MTIQIIAQVFSLLVGIFSFYKKSISISGLVALLIISSLFIWLNQVALLFIVFFMFASSSILSKVKKEAKKELEKVVSKTGPRDYIQALANLGTATFCMLAFVIFKEEYWIVGLLGSVATANADSWASEIGGISKKTPVLITTFKTIKKGISGGITLLGTIGGILGSIILSLFGVWILTIFDFVFMQKIWLIIVISSITGIIGFFLDSYVGVWFQALYKNKKGEETENPQQAVLIKGFSWCTNDMVNFITTFLGGIIGVLLYLTALYFF